MHRRDNPDGFALAAEFPELGGYVLRRKILSELDADLDLAVLDAAGSRLECLGEVPVPGARRLMQQEPEAVLGAFCGDVAAN